MKLRHVLGGSTLLLADLFVSLAIHLFLQVICACADIVVLVTLGIVALSSFDLVITALLWVVLLDTLTRALADQWTF